MARRSLSERLGHLEPQGPRLPPRKPPPASPPPEREDFPEACAKPVPPGGGGIRDRLARLVERELRNRGLTQREGAMCPAPDAPEGPAGGGEGCALEASGPDQGFEVYEGFYPGEASWKDVCLEQLTREAPQAWPFLVPGAGAGGFAAEELLFFDTETTGLAGGTGTLPFMLGMGFWEGGGFRVRIQTLTHPGREAAFLEAFQQWLGPRPFRLLVTYNGAAFDLPLMDTRFVLARRPNPLRAMAHLDLLRFARLLWKRDNPSCRLSHLGERYLGISREGDLPGQEIPALYNLCLRTGRFRPLERVREHNALDLVGLAGLLVLVADYLCDRREPSTPGVRLGLGQLLCLQGSPQRGQAHLVKGAEQGCDDLWVLRRLSEMARQQADWGKARLWGLKAGAAGDWRPLQALAIHLEHRLGDIQGALDLVEEVLVRVGEGATREVWRHRGRRLLRRGGQPLVPGLFLEPGSRGLEAGRS